MEGRKIKIGLLPRLVIGICVGLAVGYLSASSGLELPVKLFATFNDLFGAFLGFSIPLVIIGFVVPGIGDLGSGAGKTLALTASIAYVSTLLSGLLAFFTDSLLFKTFLTPGSINLGNTDANSGTLSGYVTFSMPPIMSVTTALIFAFVLGIGVASVKGDSIKNVFKELQNIISKLISAVIIPLLPIHVAGIFCNMTYAGTVFSILSVFIKVFGIVIVLHYTIIIIQYFIAGSMVQKNPFTLIKNMVPAYFTALGTQSSAATIPVTMEQTKKNGVSDKVADFAIPLCATIHMSGSAITLTSCAMAIMMLGGMDVSFNVMFPFIAMLGVTIVAAPGVPGGAVMAAMGIIQSMLGFNEAQVSLIIALYIAQDSFGTSCNVTGDGAIALIVDKLTNKKGRANKENEEEIKVTA